MVRLLRQRQVSIEIGMHVQMVISLIVRPAAPHKVDMVWRDILDAATMPVRINRIDATVLDHDSLSRSLVSDSRSISS